MELESILTELRLFKLSYFLAFLHGRVWSLYNQLLLQFSMDVSKTVQTYCVHIGGQHVGF